jgi:hypothetical protein
VVLKQDVIITGKTYAQGFKCEIICSKSPVLSDPYKSKRKASLSVVVFRDVMPCVPVHGYQCFEKSTASIFREK